MSILNAISRVAITFLVMSPGEPAVSSPLHWFMMPIAMVIGFVTAYPANCYLANKGIKHAM